MQDGRTRDGRPADETQRIDARTQDEYGVGVSSLEGIPLHGETLRAATPVFIAGARIIPRTQIAG
jgi:hypothetical protein